MAQRIGIKKEWEGRMGCKLTPIFEGYVDGELVTCHSRKWIVQAVCEAIVAAHISASGDTVAKYAVWAATHDRAAFERLPENL